MAPIRQKRNRKPRPFKYVGIVADAAALGVTYSHLWRVLEGKRSSRSLLRRYFALHPKKKAA